jgi:hypothetical protein
MSRTSTFGFTNSTASSNTVTPLKLGLTTNYALVKDVADVVDLSNKTTPIDQEELITLRSRKIDNISTTVTVNNPSPVKGGIEYGIKLEEVLKTTDSDDATFEVDDPIVCTIAFRHKRSGYISNSVIGTVFLRAISTLMREDGTWRFDDLMRSAERPVAN